MLLKLRRQDWGGFNNYKTDIYHQRSFLLERFSSRTVSTLYLFRSDSETLLFPLPFFIILSLIPCSSCPVSKFRFHSSILFLLTWIYCLIRSPFFSLSLFSDLLCKRSSRTPFVWRSHISLVSSSKTYTTGLREGFLNTKDFLWRLKGGGRILPFFLSISLPFPLFIY